MGDSGHNFYEAVAEFIDNSIDARTTRQVDGNEQLCIDIIINVKKKFLSIIDNGTGMNRKNVEKAATIAKSDKTSIMLGHYGFGLQSGLMTISDNFNLSSGMEGNNYCTKFDYDELTWSKDPDNWELDAANFPKELSEHGTTITINKVKHIQLSTNKTQYLKNDIAKRYRSFIQKGDVKITVNNVEIKTENVAWAKGYPINFNILTKYGEIYGKIGLMKESSQKGYYGFDVFRNGRMILTNSKFAIGEHPTTARICGEIHLNFVKVSHEKNKFNTESKEYQVAEQACKDSQEFKNILKEARKKIEDVDNKKENTSIDKDLEARMPFIAQVLKNIEQAGGLSNNNGAALAEAKTGILEGFFDKITGKKRGPYDKKDESSNPNSPHIPEENTDIEPDNGKLIKINGLAFQIKREYIFDANMGRKSSQYDDANKILIVYINKAYAGFKSTKDKTTYCFETVIDALVGYLYMDHVIILEKYNETKDDLISGTLKLMEMLTTEEQPIPELILRD